MGNPKSPLPHQKKIVFLKYAYLSVYAVMFCEQFLAYTVHIDRSAFSCNP